MITVRKASERGHFDFGWLDTHHTFSFGDYFDPGQMGFRSLRVLNEDRVAPGRGFGAHPHRDMEIITYVLDGAVEHADNTGSRGVIRPGIVQRMSAGSGIVHSERNESATAPVHFLQVWITPDRPGVPARYEDRPFPLEQRRNRLALLISPDGADGSLDIHQDAKLFAGVLDAGTRLDHSVAAGRHAWVQIARGQVTLNGVTLAEGDGAAVSAETGLAIEAISDAEVLVFDLA
ncbi:MAG TPA: pirin family protein [Vicinamibacterales bacterium]|nr:pirin family protein [Vicinamibacterales bacterium]